MDSEWSAWSDREIAKRCNVSRELVGDLRPVTVRNDSEKQSEKTYTTKHGTTATMNTANIGKRQEPREEPREEAKLAGVGHENYFIIPLTP
ncbi:MAG: hypothetical protein AB7T74_03010 [Clostridia bacterium]